MDPSTRARTLLAEAERELRRRDGADRKIVIAQAYATLAVAEQMAQLTRAQTPPERVAPPPDPDEAVW